MERQQLPAREPLVEAEVLGKEADSSPRPSITQRGAEQLSRAPVGAGEAQQHLHRRCLAGAVGTEEAEDLSPRHAQGEVADSRSSTERFVQSPGLDGRSAHESDSAISRSSTPSPFPVKAKTRFPSTQSRIEWRGPLPPSFL